jgi:hypothetical protein
MRPIRFLVVALAIGMVAGCEMLGPDSSYTDQTPDLSEYGGYNLNDEAPGFGDPDLASGYPEDQPFDDEFEDHPDVRDTAGHKRAKHYALRIVWGNLGRCDSTISVGEDCPVTDWSGSLRVSAGVVTVRRLIRFDAEDYVVRPRPGPQEVEWVSYTKPHFDGILFHIRCVPRPTTVDTEGAVTIETPLYTARIPFGDLEDYREFVIYDECNKISVVATEITPSNCPRGFLEGIWVAETDTSGHFKGIWIDKWGGLDGHVKARYTIREGRRVLHGKVIGRGGRFEGLLKGTWTPIDEPTGPDGYFEGRWVDKELDVKGFFRGHYCICESGHGFFHGRWLKSCR